MKRTSFLALVVALMLVLGFSVVASAQAATPGATCPNGAFVDADGDGVCDNAPRDGSGQQNGRQAGQQTGRQMGQGAMQGQGRSFVDADGDGVCDNFVDADGDGVCDNCMNSGGQSGLGRGMHGGMGMGRGMHTGSGQGPRR